MDAATRVEERQRRGERMAAFWRSRPEPMATLAEVLEVPCATCGAEAGAGCAPAPARILGLALPSLASVHTRRYLDLTHDPR
jgi:hypothetical protein